MKQWLCIRNNIVSKMIYVALDNTTKREPFCVLILGTSLKKWEKNRNEQNLFTVFAFSLRFFRFYYFWLIRAKPLVRKTIVIVFCCSSHFPCVILSICFGISIIQPNNFESNKLRSFYWIFWALYNTWEMWTRVREHISNDIDWLNRNVY